MHVVPGLLMGGMELAMAQVISGLQGKSMRHSVVCLKEEPKMADRLPSDVEIECMHARPNEPQLPFRLARLIREVRPTVIHARNWGAWPDTVAAGLLVWPRVPVVLSFHGVARAGYMPRRRRIASFVLARMASALMTVSEQAKHLVVSRWGWPSQKTVVIPNGVDTNRFDTGKRTERRGAIVVGAVGNLNRIKNHALLIEACGRLVRQGCDLEVRIAGEGDQRSMLLALAKSLEIPDRLQLVGRVDNVPAFLRDLDVFVLPSDSEQHPNALNEAMACGLACIATRVGCVEEMLDDGRCGIVVPPGDAEALSSALSKLTVDEVLRQQLGAVARQQACEKYSLKTMLSRYEELYCWMSKSKEMATSDSFP